MPPQFQHSDDKDLGEYRRNNQNQTLLVKIRDLEQQLREERGLVNSYRAVNNDKASECVKLKKEVEALKKQLESAGNASSWNPLQSFQRPSLQRELEECRAKYTTQIENLKSQNSKLHTQYSRLEEKLEEREQALRAQVTEFAQELDKIRDQGSFTVSKVSDGEIKNQWKALCFLVRQFVEEYLPESPLDQPTLERIEARTHHYFVLQPGMRHHLQSPLFCSVLLESLIWHCLSYEVFCSSSKSWAGKIGAKFIQQSEQLLDLIRNGPYCLFPADTRLSQFHAWRAASAHFIRQTAHDPNRPTKVAEAIFNALAPLKSQAEYSHVRDGCSQFQDAVLEIASAAINLNSIFRTSKASFTVFGLSVNPISLSEFEFDPRYMELSNRLPNPSRLNANNTAMIIDLGISPGILKAGTADGTRYDESLVLVKFQVMSSLQMALLEVSEPTQANQIMMSTETATAPTKIKQEDTSVDESGDAIMHDANLSKTYSRTSRSRAQSETLRSRERAETPLRRGRSKTPGSRDRSKAARKDRSSRSRTPRGKTPVD